MFKILQNPKATSTQLRETYIEAEKFVKALSIEKEREYKALMVAQVECFSAKPTKEFLTAKKKLDDISTRIEGCRFGQEQIKARLGEVLQKEAKQRLGEIEQELSEISCEKRRINQEFLNSAAKAAVLREKLKGITLTHDCKGNYQPCVPSLEVKINLMDQSDAQIFLKCVEHYRSELTVGDFSQTLRGRESFLADEREKLEKLLQTDPEGAAQDLLNRLCPQKQTIEKPAENEKPKTHPAYPSKPFERDYDRISVEY